MVLLAIDELGRHTLPALRDLLQTNGPTIARRAIHIDVDERTSQELQRQWREHRLQELGLPLVLLPSDFGGGDVVGDLVNYVRDVLAADSEMTVELVIPEWTSGTAWWQWLFTRMLHHLTGSRLKLAFLAQNRVTVTNHRYVLDGRA